MKALLIGAAGLALIAAQAGGVAAQTSGGSSGTSAGGVAASSNTTGSASPSGSTIAPGGVGQSAQQSLPGTTGQAANNGGTGAAASPSQEILPGTTGAAAQATTQGTGATDPSAASPAPSDTSQAQLPGPSGAEPQATPAAQDAANAGGPAANLEGAQPAAWDGPVPNAYIGAAPALQPDEVNAFLANTRSIMDANLVGGGVMVRSVRSLIGSDNRTVLPLVDLTKQPDIRDQQVAAIAIGFASAVREAETPAPEYAAYLQWAVAQSNAPDFIKAFEIASGADEEATAALGTGAAGGRGTSPSSGSLNGNTSIGPSGPVGSVASPVIQTVETNTLRRSISLDGGTRNSGGSTAAPGGNTTVCERDASPAGCVQPL